LLDDPRPEKEKKTCDGKNVPSRRERAPALLALPHQLHETIDVASETRIGHSLLSFTVEKNANWLVCFLIS
jgi:hypothetical protein